jgi:putative membrane protein
MKSYFVVIASAVALSSSVAWAQGASPNDAQIAAIVVVANQVDIDAGELAQSKASNAQIKEFAKRMVTDHAGVNQAARDLVKKLNVAPQESATSKSLKQGGDETLRRLRRLKDAEFDRAYVQNEIAYHQTVLDALDKTLIPNAKNGELKALLVKVRPAFVAHLEHAKHLGASVR